MRVELGVGVSFDTLYKMYIDRTRDCLYIRRVESRDSEEGDGKVKEV